MRQRTLDDNKNRRRSSMSATPAACRIQSGWKHAASWRGRGPVRVRSPQLRLSGDGVTRYGRPHATAGDPIGRRSRWPLQRHRKQRPDDSGGALIAAFLIDHPDYDQEWKP